MQFPRHDLNWFSRMEIKLHIVKGLNETRDDGEAVGNGAE
ncbi:conserved hypothetical protein [delta proteobacterium NaphS2]|nr:conserved hypothetical protein [delta proteobacterium NaphS2]